MTLPVLHPRPGNLREVAEQIEASTGLRVEIIGGSLVISPTPRGKRGGTIRRLRVQIERLLPERLAPYEVSSVAMPEDMDDYATPDLTALPVRWDEDDSWLADPGDVALAVEVISQSEKAKDITDKNGWYARAGVSVLLVLDPRTGRWKLHTRPRGGEYHGRLDGEYGETIDLLTDRHPLDGRVFRGGEGAVHGVQGASRGEVLPESGVRDRPHHVEFVQEVRPSGLHRAEPERAALLAGPCAQRIRAAVLAQVHGDAQRDLGAAVLLRPVAQRVVPREPYLGVGVQDTGAQEQGDGPGGTREGEPQQRHPRPCRPRPRRRGRRLRQPGAGNRGTPSRRTGPLPAPGKRALRAVRPCPLRGLGAGLAR